MYINKMKFLLVAFAIIVIPGLLDARNVIVFNNHQSTVHIRVWREYNALGSLMGQSEKIVLKPGESIFIRNYKEDCNSLHYYVPGKNSVRVHKYKKFELAKESEHEDILVELYPEQLKQFGGFWNSMKRNVRVQPIASLDEQIQDWLSKFEELAHIEKEINCEMDGLYLLAAFEEAKKYMNSRSVWATEKLTFVETCMRDLPFNSEGRDAFDRLKRSLLFVYEKRVRFVFSRLREFLSILGNCCNAGSSNRRGLLVFNNHKDSVHVKQEYCGESSETIDLAPGQVIFIPDYKQRSINYYVPNVTGLRNAFLNWGRFYKEYNFEEDSSGDDSLVILRPSFAEHNVEHSAKKGVLQVMLKKAQAACGLFLGADVKQSADKVLSSLENSAVSSDVRVSIKRAIGFYGLTAIKKEIAIQGENEQEEEGEQEDMQPVQIADKLAIEKLIELGRKIDIIRNVALIKRKNVAVGCNLSDLEANAIWAERMMQLLEDSLREQGVSSDVFTQEIEALEKKHSESYENSIVCVMQAGSNFLSTFNQELRELIAELGSLKVRAESLLDQERCFNSSQLNSFEETDNFHDDSVQLNSNGLNLHDDSEEEE